LRLTQPAAVTTEPAKRAKPQINDLDPATQKPKYNQLYQFLDDLLAWQRDEMLATFKGTRPKAPVKCRTLANCQAQMTLLRRDADAALDGWRQAMNDRDQATNERDKLKTENAELAKKYDDAITILAAVNNHILGKPYSDEQTKKFKDMLPGEALNLGASIETGQNNLFSYATKVSQHDSEAVDKYNALLADYKDYVTRVGIQFAQIGQYNRVNNALSLYQMMQKPTTQTINVNVTDCTKLPALCVH
jgi:ribosome modulation factor